MEHVVYRITNMINGKKYIGKHSTTDVYDGYFGSGIAIKQAINKYGIDNFKKEIICYCNNEEELKEMEKYHIKKEGTFSKGYNLTLGGEGILGYKHTEDSIKKASDSRKRYYEENPEMREKISEMAKKRVGKLNSFYGRKLSQEHIDKLTVSRVKAITGVNNPSAKSVICNETGVKYDLAQDAATAVGLKYSTTILKVCKNIRKSAGGFTWRYA